MRFYQSSIRFIIESEEQKLIKLEIYESSSIIFFLSTSKSSKTHPF
jgi:hypothetical protein